MTRVTYVIAAALIALGGPVAAQQSALPVEAGTEIGNFGDVPFSAPAIALTRPEDRAAWRTLEDKHIKEMREFEDKIVVDLRMLRKRQADERDALLATFKR